MHTESTISKNSRIKARRPRMFGYTTIYIAVVLAALVTSSLVNLRTAGIFACQAASSGTDEYLAYCQSAGFGDYDHGAFWYELDESATSAAMESEVLFIGNSRMQFGFSSTHVDDLFERLGKRFYMLGFSHMENQTFIVPLIERLEPAADAYIINIDLFFSDRLSPPGRVLLTDDDALTRYRAKRRWQHVQEFVCQQISVVCGSEAAFYRTRATGKWTLNGGNFGGRETAVYYDTTVDNEMLESYLAQVPLVLSQLDVRPECVLFTLVPQSGTTLGTAKALAAQSGIDLVAPEVAGLMTFDGSHLDVDSADRWSAAFVARAEPYLHTCFTGREN